MGNKLVGVLYVPPKNDGVDYNTLRVWHIADRDATAVQVTVKGRKYTGVAKRSKGEPYDFYTGYDLALGRALLRAGYDLERATLDKVGRYSELDVRTEQKSVLQAVS